MLWHCRLGAGSSEGDTRRKAGGLESCEQNGAVIKTRRESEFKGRKQITFEVLFNLSDIIIIFAPFFSDK